VISRRVAINLTVFLLAAVALVLYGVLTLFGNPLDHPRKAYAVFPNAGGLHPKFQVSLDGVPVGEVSSIALEHNDGVRIGMTFDLGTRIPDDVQARIIRSSAVGEQRVDLTPMRGGHGGRLANGANVPVARQDAVPPDVGQVLTQVTNLLGQLPASDLNNLVHEAAVGFAGRAQDLKSIVDSLTTLSSSYLQHDVNFRQLLNASPTLLNGVASSAADLQQSLDRTRSLTQLLVNRRADLVTLLRNLTTLGDVGNNFLLANRVNLTCVLSDLADTNQWLQGANLTNLQIGLETNLNFFGTVDKIAPKGYAKDLGLGAPTRTDQTWLRVRTLLPPGQPSGAQYTTPLAVPPTKPGAACQNVYGQGVGPVSQGAGYQLLYGAQLVPPTAADSVAPKPNLTGPASAASAIPAALRSPAAPNGDPGGWTQLLVVLSGVALLAAMLVVVPYVRYRWRN